MNSTAVLNRREIERLQAQRAHLQHEADTFGDCASGDLMRERLAEIDRAIAWCQREIAAEQAPA